MKKKSPEYTFLRKLRQIKKAGIEADRPLNTKNTTSELDSVENRVQKIFAIFKGYKQKPTHVIFFVMYDIEDDKVRKEVAKYLEKKGCVRVQKSIFLAELDRARYREIAQALKEVNEIYDNEDSILLVPVSTDQVQAMKMIGQQIDLDIILGNQNTLFF